MNLTYRLDQCHTVADLNEFRNEVRARLRVVGTNSIEARELRDIDDEVYARLSDFADRESKVKGLSRRPSTDDPYDLSSIRIVPGDPSVAAAQYRDRAMRCVEKAVFPSPLVNREDAQGRIASLLERDEEGHLAHRIVATGSETYRRAFARKVAGHELSRDEERALTLGTPKAGAGLAVPFQLDPTVLGISNGVVNPIRQIARVETLVGTDEWRGLTRTAGVAHYRAEGDEMEDDSPTVAQPTVRAQRADSFIPFSRELGQDWGALLSELSAAVLEAKDELESVQFWSGVGTTVFPEGVFAGIGTTQRVPVATNGAFVLNDVYSLVNGIPPRHRAGMAFMASIVNLNRVRAFDTNGTLYTTLTASDPGQLVGKPTYENSAMPTALTANLAVLFAGDFSRYLIVDRVGMEVEVIPNLVGANRRPTAQRGFTAFWRNSAKVLDDNAFRYLASTA